MLPKELLKSLNLSSQKDLKMAENMWKMLDDMSDSKPEEYREFVNKNLKEGFEGMRQEQEKKEQKLKIVPEVGFLIKMKAKLLEQSLDTSKNQKFNIKLDKLESWQSVSSKFDKEIKIYLNVCFSARVLLPLDANNSEISTFTASSLKQIVTIPHSLQPPVTKLNSAQQKVYYYVLILNNQVYNNLQKINMPYLMNLSISLFQERLTNHSNPLYKLYNPKEYGKAVYYQIQKPTIELHKKRRFKVLKQSEPNKVLLEAGADKQQSTDVNKKKQPADVKFKQQEQVVSEIKLPSLSALEKKAQQQSAKPVKKFIVEVDEQQRKTDDTSIPFTLKKTEGDIGIEFLVHGVASINDMELDISTTCVKLKIKNTNKQAQIELGRAVNVEQVRAKMAKKEGKLKVTLPYV